MQEWIVAAVVAYAVWVVAKRYSPKTLRLATRIWTIRAAKKIGWKRMVARLEADVKASGASGCGTCNGCGTSDAAPADKNFSITPEALKRAASNAGKRA